MTAPTTYRAKTEQPDHCASTLRPPPKRVDLLRSASAVFRPLVITIGVITACATQPATAHADPSDNPIIGALTNGGGGNNGPLNNTAAGLGQQICPMLVKPGASLASIMSQVGNTGLPPGMAGFVASMAIQMECPGMIASLANGQMPFPIQGGLPGMPGLPNALQAPGGNTAPGLPFSAAPAGPAGTSPFPLPGS